MRYINPNVDFSLPIVKISIVVTLLRFILFISMFIPLFIAEIIPNPYQNHLGKLSIILLIVFIVFIKFKSNYQKVGSVDFFEDYFTLSNEMQSITSSNHSKVKINYNGFEGDYHLIKFNRNGINEIFIEQDNAKFHYKFLSEHKGDLALLANFKSRFAGQMSIDISGDRIT